MTKGDDDDDNDEPNPNDVCGCCGCGCGCGVADDDTVVPNPNPKVDDGGGATTDAMEDEGVAPKPNDPNNVDVGPGAAPTTSVLLPNGIAVELDVIVVVGANACDSPEEDDPNDNNKWCISNTTKSCTKSCTTSCSKSSKSPR